MSMSDWRAAVAALLAATAWQHCIAAQVDAYAIDRFAVLRTTAGVTSGVVDSFSDGILPPKGPDGTTNIYLIRDFPWPAGSESDGRLHFSRDAAAPTMDPEGRSFLTQRARLLTSTDPGESGGLRADGVFTVAGVFDLSMPQFIGEGYGIGLTDSTAVTLGDDVIDLMVARDQANKIVIQLRRLNWTNQEIVLFGQFDVDFSLGDQINLSLAKLDSQRSTVQASFQYLSEGILVGTPSRFAITPAIFRGENFTRAEFQAVYVVPEPGSGALLAVGLAALFLRSMRTARTRPQ